MQKVEGLLIFNDIFVSKGISRNSLTKAVSRAFQIPESNIFFENEDTGDWSDAPVSAFVYGYKGGDIDWKLDVISKDFADAETILTQLADYAGVPVLYDQRSQQGDSRVDVYDTDRLEDAAELLEREDDSGDLTLYVKRADSHA